MLRTYVRLNSRTSADLKHPSLIERLPEAQVRSPGTGAEWEMSGGDVMPGVTTTFAP